MKFRMYYILVIAIAIAGLSGLSFSYFSSNANAYVGVSNQDFVNEGNSVNREIEISQWSNLLTISLDSDPSTGYEWEIASLEGDDIVSVTGDNYLASETGDTYGQDVWTFNIRKSGTGTIVMEYTLPGETASNGNRKLNLTVTAD